MNKQPKILYHITPTKNLESILKKGLIPYPDRYRPIDPVTHKPIIAVYFTSKYWLEDTIQNGWIHHHKKLLSVLRVTIPDEIQLKSNSLDGYVFEWFSHQIIQPQHIKHIYNIRKNVNRKKDDPVFSIEK